MAEVAVISPAATPYRNPGVAASADTAAAASIATAATTATRRIGSTLRMRRGVVNVRSPLFLRKKTKERL
jgi:hypothetical protein